jgi:hypothetical protein
VRGEIALVGARRVSANGYHYIKTETGWRLTHHLVAEKKLGRQLHEDERVTFENGNRNDLSPENIVVKKKYKVNPQRRAAQLRARILDLEAELAELEQANG